VELVAVRRDVDDLRRCDREGQDAERNLLDCRAAGLTASVVLFALPVMRKLKYFPA
jgi:hypothetical protein